MTLQVERLKTLYAVISGIPEKKLDLESWRSGRIRARAWYAEEVPVTDKALLHTCGTTACAVGYACVYPEFVKQGLTFNRAENTPTFEGQGSWTAVTRFFGILPKEAQYLFANGTYAPPGAPDTRDREAEIEFDLSDKLKVLRRIRRFLWKKRAITKTRNQELARQEGSVE